MRGLQGFYRRLASEGARGGAERLLLVLLTPLGWLYGVAGLLRVALYRRQALASYRAGVPVVSVGNLSVGGTGKTPTVEFVVRHLLRAGKTVAVVSRGYGGSARSGVTLVCGGQGPLVAADICGDEPYLLARRLPEAIVLVAPRRAEGVRVAQEEFGADVVVLDDGFQHLAVQRDLDIVLLDGRRPLGNGKVLPAGLLREFPLALGRADLFLLTRSRGDEPGPRGLSRPVLRCRHRLAGEAISLAGEPLELANLAGLRGAAFAGIADPEGFFRDLRAAGLALSHAIGFADHAGYGPRELERLARVAAEVDYLITTEKDGVKLGEGDFSIPCYQVPLSLEFFQPGGLEAKLNALFEENTMPLSPELLEIIACPQCKGEVKLREGGDALVCEACRLLYPVRDDIPVMLIDEAQSLDQA
ncbi:tetraacyldisaccharide 4'-kinase [Desulfuromonas versatilis]|uniref:Multifunctional fusion protein n=1 Tax=Desulfuromonas versatilis TaxID=2802975 RepID=A0ABM8HSD1_9BACT|nr:tetraacyldisaccharide 4'-kinase [Desulfuromonas versatilis]BCR05200.1 tetraacyldisaccharide 4'-kinase [Desulfuromonas versatilis]